MTFHSSNNHRKLAR